MTLPTFALVALAAVLHALWNLAAKRAAGNIGVFWLGLGCASLLLAPVAVPLALHDLKPAGLPCILATGSIHTVYFGLLAAAYRQGEMSVVYPLARGSGVAGTAVVASVFLGEPLSPVGTAGILFITAGILLLGVRELATRGTWHASLLALLVGGTIVAYSVVDKLGVGLVHPVVYLTGLVASAALLLTPYVLLRCQDECREAWANRKAQAAGVGLGIVATYLLILFAFQTGHVSYVVAVRELSIVVVAVLSVTVLREPLTVPRCLSTIAILVGATLVKLA